MANQQLTITGKGGRREFSLSEKGAVIGRHPDCDIVLDDEHVSRRHARLFRDPFGRWIIEDLGSRHGILVGGRKIQAAAVGPEDGIFIKPFLLTLEAKAEGQIAEDPETAASTATSLVDDARAGGQLEIQKRPEQGEALSSDWLAELNLITGRLAAVPSSAGLYRETCRCLVQAPGRMCLVLRLPVPPRPLPPSPTVLARGILKSADHGEETRGEPLNIHLSQRVLEAVRESSGTVMATDGGGTDGDIGLTVESEGPSRAVLCAQIAQGPDSVDVLYLDVTAREAHAGAMDFVQSLARHLRFARESLLLADARAERKALDGQLEMARHIQHRLTPTPAEAIPGLELAICYQPAMWVGGDYCAAWAVGDGRAALAVADVMGKGLPAAMLMANLHGLLRSSLGFCNSPEAAITYVNRELRENLPEGGSLPSSWGSWIPPAALWSM